MESKEIPYVSMESKEIPYVSMDSKEITYISIESKEIPYVSMDTKEDMLRNSIHQHGHKIRHVKKFHTSAWTQNKAC